MTTDQRLDSERKLLRLRLALAVAIVALLGWIGYSLFESNLRAAQSAAESEVAKSNSQTLAEDIKTICAQEGKVLLDDRDLCAKAEAVQQQPTEAIAGPKGDRGNDGADGKTGAAGAKGDKGDTGAKGDKGDKGVEGVDATGTPGTAGLPGADGAKGDKGDKGDPGEDGAPGTDGAPGANGADGANGQDGRGIADTQCRPDGRWAITYTDGTTHDAGNCAATPPIGVGP